MADDRSSMFIGAALATAAGAGAAYYWTRRDRPAFAADSSVVPIFTPMIDLYTVDEVFARMERIRGDEVTLVLHTPGGCVASCVMIGRRAALSAVDPVVQGQRARHIEAGDEAGRHAMAQEYYKAVQRQLRGMLTRHLGAGPNLERALSVFMGLDAPHEWPIYTSQLAELGLPVTTADPMWTDYVDSHRRGWR